MLDNSPNSQQYPCLLHRKDKVTHICTYFRCTSNPLLCGNCLAQGNNRSLHGGHQQFLLLINEAIPELAMIVEANKSEMSKLFNSTVGKKEYELLLRKIDMGERHYAMVEEHIKTLKGQVDKEAEALQSEFVKRLQSHKQAMHNQLDNYHRTYMQNMEAYRALLEPILTFHGKFKYYCSASSISLKLLSEIRRKSTEWYLDLKRIMTVASRVVDRPLVMQDNLARSTQYMSCVCEQLPFARQTDMDGRTNRIQMFISDCLGEALVLRDIKPLTVSEMDITGPKSTTTVMTTGTSIGSIGSQKEINMPSSTRLMAGRPTPRY